MPAKKKSNAIPFTDVVHEYLTDLRIANLSPATIESYRQTLDDFARRMGQGQSLAVGQLSSALAKAYQTARLNDQTIYQGNPKRKSENRPLSAYSLHRITRNLRAFGTWLGKNGYANPFKELQLPKLPKGVIEPLTLEEIEKLFAIWNPDTLFGCRWQAMLSFFLDTGVRVSELCTLRMDTLDLNSYRAKVTGKGSKDRYIFFGNRTHRLLSKYIHNYRDSACPFVFVSVDGEAISTNGVRQIVTRAGKKTAVKRLHCHLFRHTYATLYAQKNPGDVFGLQTSLGHESLQISQRYVHLAQMLGVPGARRTSPLDDLEAGGLSFKRRRGGQRGEVPQQKQGV